MLVVWAVKAGTRLALNEISPLRRDCLGTLFPHARVTGHNAELVDEPLAPASDPRAVLMNQPYSHWIERRTEARRSAWNRLAKGGRLVAIMPEWFDCPKFFASIRGPLSLQLNATVERAFVGSDGPAAPWQAHRKRLNFTGLHPASCRRRHNRPGSFA